MCVPSGAPSGWSVGNDSNGGTGKNDAFATLSASFSAMSGTDELIICDGTYTGTSNVISGSNMPPAGTSITAPTIVGAENTGSVIFDGEDTRSMFTVAGTPGGNSDIKYWKFQGIQWTRSNDYAVYLGVGSENPDGGDDYKCFVYFKSCGFHSYGDVGGTGNAIRLYGLQYVLVEDCWGWGAGRYTFSSQHAQYIVWRRCVQRFDDVEIRPNAHYPAAGFASYAAQYVEFQNCISLDWDNEMWKREGAEEFSDRDPTGAFYLRLASLPTYPAPAYNYFRGCMVLNTNASYPSSNDTRLSGWYIQGDPENTELHHCIVWDSSKGIIARNMGSGNDIIVDHVTVGNLGNYVSKETDGTWQGGILNSNSGGGTMTVTNCNAVNGTHTVVSFPGIDGDDSNSDYNNCYGNDDNTPDNGSNNTTVDPLMDYIVRVETDSPNYNTGSSGHKGATVLYQYGEAGAFYGYDADGTVGTGYKDLTANSLWPWPNETIIKTWFSKDWGTTDETRGFCSTGLQQNGVDTITLTSYVWEYLGNLMPTSIYGVSPNAATKGVTIGGGMSRSH